MTTEANSIYRIDNKAQYYSFVKTIMRHSFFREMLAAPF